MSDCDQVTEPVVPVDVVPTIDSSEPVATYPDWDRERTVVRTYLIGGTNTQVDPRKPIRWAPTIEAARAETVAERGRIYEETHLPGRSYFRVGLAPTSSATKVPREGNGQ